MRLIALFLNHVVDFPIQLSCLFTSGATTATRGATYAR